MNVRLPVCKCRRLPTWLSRRLGFKSHLAAAASPSYSATSRVRPSLVITTTMAVPNGVDGAANRALDLTVLGLNSGTSMVSMSGSTWHQSCTNQSPGWY